MYVYILNGCLQHEKQQLATFEVCRPSGLGSALMNQSGPGQVILYV